MPACHPMARDLHADVSSAAVEIYAGSVGLSQGMRLSYVSDKLRISSPTPVCIGVNNATAVAYANGTVKCSKIRRINARQDWVGAMRDDNICKLQKVDMKENEPDLLTKIHEADQFERLRYHCMVFRQIPKEQPADADSLQVKLGARRQQLRRQRGICAWRATNPGSEPSGA